MYGKQKIIQELIKLREQSKFNEDISIFYLGIKNIELKKLLTFRVNNIIDKFIGLVNKDMTDNEYQVEIRISLSKFDIFELDTEERERLCQYFEQIMDVIGLESSGGVINKWLYGFEI